MRIASMTPTEQDKELNKLVWLVRVHKNSHYGCEYRQDGMERASVKCGGCHHSSQNIKRAEQNIIDFVSNITADRERVELEARIDELERTMPHTDGMRHYNTVKNRIAELKQQLLLNEEEK